MVDVVVFEMGFVVRVECSAVIRDVVFGVVFGGDGVFLARIRNRLVETFRLQNPLGEETPRAPLRVVQRRQRRSERERFVMRALRRQPRFVFFSFRLVENGPPVARELFVAERFVAERFVVVVAREADVRAGASRPEELVQKRRRGPRVRRRGDAHLRHHRVQDVQLGGHERRTVWTVWHDRETVATVVPFVAGRFAERFAEHSGRGRHPQRDRRRGRVRLRDAEAGACAAPRDDGKLRLVLRAVRADAPEREHGARPAPLRFFHFFLFSAVAPPRTRVARRRRKRLRREHARFGSVRAAGFGRRGAQTHARSVTTSFRKDRSVFRSVF